MTKLRMFRKMTEDERTNALEAVMAGKLHLFVLIPKTGDYVVPKGTAVNELNTKMAQYLCEGGFFEFKDGKAAASNILAGVPHVRTTLLNEEGIEVNYVGFISPDPDSEVIGQFRGYAQLDIYLDNLDLLAVDDFLGEEKVNQYLIPTPEFAAVMDIWEKYWSEDKGNTKAFTIVDELQKQGFKEVRARAIEMICRPEKYRTGGRTKN